MFTNSVTTNQHVNFLVLMRFKYLKSQKIYKISMLLCFLKDVKDCFNDPNFVYNAVSRRKQSGAGEYN